MASSSGTSSGSSLLQNSGSDEDRIQLMDERKRKRKISNRESARRSRMRKQQHLDDLMAQVSHLKKENSQILTRLKATNHQFLSFESENSVLRVQVAELSHRLQSLNEIITLLNINNGGFCTDLEPFHDNYQADMFTNTSWNSHYANLLSMPCADMLLC